MSIDDIDSITYYIPLNSDLPVITTNAVSILSPTTAFWGGDVTYEGTSSVLQKGICWSTSSNPTLANSFTNDGSGIGTFNSNIYPLSPTTNYYLRAYATNSSGTAYGNVVTFTTPNPSSSGTLAIVSTTVPSYVDGLIANCGGNITSDGGLAVQARGVCWAIGITPTIANSFTIDGAGAGNFSSTLVNLLPNTSYFVRAFATNDAGTAYGNSYSFTTNSLPIVSTDLVSNITTGSCNVSGTTQSQPNSPITARGICWGYNAQPTISNFVVTCGSGTGTFNGNIFGILKNSTFYVRTFATTAVGTSYGNIYSSNTLDFTANQGVGVNFDGHNYQTVVFGNGQEWFSENLKTSIYANGDIIENFADDAQWLNTNIGSWCYLLNNSAYNDSLGKLYNGYAVSDARNVCPTGWHVPLQAEWDIFITYIGGSTIAGSKMKLNNSSYWLSPNLYSTNESFFNSRGSGFRACIFTFGGVVGFNLTVSLFQQSAYWSGDLLSTPVITILNNNSAGINNPTQNLNNGYSIRCIKD